MTKRRYFTDPIQALYMMREFGVKFYIEGEQIHSCNLTTGEVDKNKKTIQIDFEEEYLDQILGSFADITELEGKIYVAKESEHIFEAKDQDKGVYFKDNDLQFATLVDINGIKLWIDSKGFGVNDEVVIILRDLKSFFNGEIEND